MLQSLHTAATGLKGQQTAIDVIANNISNINTNGYKKDRVDFKDALYMAMINPDNGKSTDNLQQGSGVIADTISKTFTIGNMTQTGETFDIALFENNAFFKVQSAKGEVNYTRDGEFHISVEDNGNYLVNGEGEYVLDDDNNKIQIDETQMDRIVIDSSGTVFNAQNEEFGNIAVVSFENPEGLEKLGGNSYAATESSGAEQALDTDSVRQGFLERSNVDLAEEITNLIKAQRAYQFSSKVLTTADQMEEKANNLRG